MTGVLLLITGTGRSGTSTMSGTLHYLGLHVPGPFLGANESNPKGFFESKWAVRFHNRITKRAGINIFDSRPNAFVRAQQAVRPANRSKLVEFLREQRAVSDQVVVKDPRSVWFQQLWREACAEADFDIKYISMLRHPAEVIGSRTTYYSDSENSDEKQRRYQALTLARWINNSLINERATRGYSRHSSVTTNSSRTGERWQPGSRTNSTFVTQRTWNPARTTLWTTSSTPTFGATG